MMEWPSEQVISKQVGYEKASQIGKCKRADGDIDVLAVGQARDPQRVT